MEASKVALPRVAAVVPLEKWLREPFLSRFVAPAAVECEDADLSGYMGTSMREWRALLRKGMRAQIFEKAEASVEAMRLAAGIFAVVKDGFEGVITKL